MNSCTQKTCTMNNFFSSLIVRKTKQTNKLFTWLYALAAPGLQKNSELLIIIINSNLEQNYFIIIKCKPKHNTSIYVCLKISRSSSNFTAESPRSSMATLMGQPVVYVCIWVLMS